MNRSYWITLFPLMLVFAVSTACLTLFPNTHEPAPAKELHKPVLTALKFDPLELPSTKVGVPYEVEIKVTQNVTPVGDFMIDPNTLPPGLELVVVEDVADTARITGIPEKPGTYTFRIDVWCYGTMVNGQMSSKEYTIIVE